MTENERKILENRLRRAATRQGLTLQKSKSRDPRAIGYGQFMIIDPQTNAILAGANPYAYSMTLDDVEEYLTGGTK